MINFLKRFFGKKPELNPDVVAGYYEDWNSRYIESFGDIFQSYATANPDDLIDYIIRSGDLQDGMAILDAGCGIGGPAIRIAKRLPKARITGITVSHTQAKVAEDKAEEEGLKNRLTFTIADFHKMSDVLGYEKFDRAIYLESLVHSHQPEVVIGETAKVLKPGGCVYIKDLFRHYDKQMQSEIDYAVERIEEIIKLNVQDVKVITGLLEKHGFEIEFCKPLEIAPDFNNGNSFMARNNINPFKGRTGPYTGTEMMYLMYYEVKARKK